MERPLVTIGLPVYNGERYLGAAIDSILAQEYDDFELLIADNASTDDSLEIAAVAAERDSRVAVHPSPVNRGAAWNYNRLVDHARGEYFKWAAHDDLVEPAFLGRCVEVLKTRQDVVLAYTRAVAIDEADQVVHAYDLSSYGTATRPSTRARSVLMDPSPCFESFGLLRTEQLRRTARIGPYTSSDRTLFLELTLLGQFHEVPEVLFRHRKHEARSVNQYSDDRARNAWFDPAWAGRRSAPRWRLLKEYAAAINRAPVRTSEKLRTRLLLAQWSLACAPRLAREAASLALGRATTIPFLQDQPLAEET